MNLLQAARLSLAAIWSTKLRSFLTMLGVVIGVFAVVALVSIGQGATSQVTQQVQGMGSNLIVVNITGRGGVSGLSYEEALTLANREGVAAASPLVSGRVTVKSGLLNKSTTVEGATPEYAEVRNHPVSQGRFLSQADLAYRQKVAVLGRDVVSELFPGQNPVGREIAVDGTTFTIIGVLEQKGRDLGGSNDDKIIIPITTAQRFLHSASVSTIYVQAASPEAVSRVEASLDAALRLHFRDENAYRFFNQSEILDTVGQVTATLTLMLGGIAGISLLVGGIGIMNIMLVSVTERTREIGVSKALGARKRDILMQFLVESAVISCLGGIIGLLLGIGAVRLINHYTGFNAVFTPQVVMLALSFSVFVGVFFGSYPANRAANLRPIEALRAE